MSILRVLGLTWVILGVASAAVADDGKTAPAKLDEAVIKREYGDARDTYFIPNGLIASQILIGLNNSRPTVRMADGNYLYSGCRHQSCDEKAAVIATPEGGILAAGLINYRCAQLRRPDDAKVPCDGDPRLTVLVKTLDAAALGRMEQLRAWAVGVAKIRSVEMRTVP